MRKLSSLRLPWPVDWVALFGRESPLILEIGFGYGAFLLHLARQNPEANIVGVEIAGQCLNHVERAIERQRLANVRAIQSTAETALHYLFTPGSLEEVHVNFPDPWFKKRHSHRRLMQRDTLDAIVSRMRPGGRFYLATDIVEYAQMSAELLAETPGLVNLLDAPWHTAMPGRVVTKYEARAQREGRPCCYFAYRRSDAPAPILPEYKELPMSHVVFCSPLTLDEMLEQFEPSEHKFGETVISTLRGYRGRKVLLIEIYVKEPTIDQHVALLVGPRQAAGEYTLQLSTLGYPRVTPGLQKAVTLVGDWLVGLHPDARLLKRSVAGE